VCVKLQYKLGHALNRLSFYYSGVSQRGGCEELPTDVSRDKAVSVVDEAINIFHEVQRQSLSLVYSIPQASPLSLSFTLSL